MEVLIPPAIWPPVDKFVPLRLGCGFCDLLVHIHASRDAHYCHECRRVTCGPCWNGRCAYTVCQLNRECIVGLIAGREVVVEVGDQSIMATLLVGELQLYLHLKGGNCWLAEVELRVVAGSHCEVGGISGNRGDEAMILEAVSAFVEKYLHITRIAVKMPLPLFAALKLRGFRAVPSEAPRLLEGFPDLDNAEEDNTWALYERCKVRLASSHAVGPRNVKRARLDTASGRRQGSASGRPQGSAVSIPTGFKELEGCEVPRDRDGILRSISEHYCDWERNIKPGLQALDPTAVTDMIHRKPDMAADMLNLSMEVVIDAVAFRARPLSDAEETAVVHMVRELIAAGASCEYSWQPDSGGDPPSAPAVGGGSGGGSSDPSGSGSGATCPPSQPRNALGVALSVQAYQLVALLVERGVHTALFPHGAYGMYGTYGVLHCLLHQARQLRAEAVPGPSPAGVCTDTAFPAGSCDGFGNGRSEGSEGRGKSGCHTGAGSGGSGDADRGGDGASCSQPHGGSLDGRAAARAGASSSTASPPASGFLPACPASGGASGRRPGVVSAAGQVAGQAGNGLCEVNRGSGSVGSVGVAMDGAAAANLAERGSAVGLEEEASKSGAVPSMKDGGTHGNPQLACTADGDPRQRFGRLFDCVCALLQIPGKQSELLAALDPSGRTPAELALDLDEPEVLEALCRSGAYPWRAASVTTAPSLIYQAACKGKQRCLGMLIWLAAEEGPSPEAHACLVDALKGAAFGARFGDRLWAAQGIQQALSCRLKDDEVLSLVEVCSSSCAVLGQVSCLVECTRADKSDVRLVTDLIVKSSQAFAIDQESLASKLLRRAMRELADPESNTRTLKGGVAAEEERQCGEVKALIERIGAVEHNLGEDMSSMYRALSHQMVGQGELLHARLRKLAALVLEMNHEHYNVYVEGKYGDFINAVHCGHLPGCRLTCQALAKGMGEMIVMISPDGVDWGSEGPVAHLLLPPLAIYSNDVPLRMLAYGGYSFSSLEVSDELRNSIRNPSPPATLEAGADPPLAGGGTQSASTSGEHLAADAAVAAVTAAAPAGVMQSKDGRSGGGPSSGGAGDALGAVGGFGGGSVGGETGGAGGGTEFVYVPGRRYSEAEVAATYRTMGRAQSMHVVTFPDVARSHIASARGGARSGTSAAASQASRPGECVGWDVEAGMTIAKGLSHRLGCYVPMVPPLAGLPIATRTPGGYWLADRLLQNLLEDRRRSAVGGVAPAASAKADLEGDGAGRAGGGGTNVPGLAAGAAVEMQGAPDVSGGVSVLRTSQQPNLPVGSPGEQQQSPKGAMPPSTAGTSAGLACDVRTGSKLPSAFGSSELQQQADQDAMDHGELGQQKNLPTDAVTVLATATSGDGAAPSGPLEAKTAGEQAGAGAGVDESAAAQAGLQQVPPRRSARRMAVTGGGGGVSSRESGQLRSGRLDGWGAMVAGATLQVRASSSTATTSEVPAPDPASGTAAAAGGGAATKGAGAARQAHQPRSGASGSESRGSGASVRHLADAVSAAAAAAAAAVTSGPRAPCGQSVWQYHVGLVDTTNSHVRMFIRMQLRQGSKLAGDAQLGAEDEALGKLLADCWCNLTKNFKAGMGSLNTVIEELLEASGKICKGQAVDVAISVQPMLEYVQQQDDSGSAKAVAAATLNASWIGGLDGSMGGDAAGAAAAATTINVNMGGIDAGDGPGTGVAVMATVKAATAVATEVGTAAAAAAAAAAILDANGRDSKDESTGGEAAAAAAAMVAAGVPMPPPVSLHLRVGTTNRDQRSKSVVVPAGVPENMVRGIFCLLLRRLAQQVSKEAKAQPIAVVTKALCVDTFSVFVRSATSTGAWEVISSQPCEEGVADG